MKKLICIFYLSLLHALCISGQPEKVWIDTDIAIGKINGDVDDGIALIMALRSTKIQIKAISVVANVDYGYRVCKKLLGWYNATNMEIPVVKGIKNAEDLGKNNEAVEALAQALKKDTLTIIALGPATNIATLLLLHPEVKSKIKKIIWCAGRTSGLHFNPGGGNINVCDCNFDHDHIAGEILLASGINIILSGYEPASSIYVSDKDILPLKSSQHQGDKWMYKQLNRWLKIWAIFLGSKEGFIPFDPVTLGSFLYPELACFDEKVSLAVVDDKNDLPLSFFKRRKLYLIASHEMNSSNKADYCYKVQPELKEIILGLLLNNLAPERSYSFYLRTGPQPDVTRRQWLRIKKSNKQAQFATHTVMINRNYFMYKTYLIMLAVFSTAIHFYKNGNMRQQKITLSVMENSSLIEQTEIAAWSDLIDAAPESFRVANGLRHHAIGGGMAINFQRVPIPLFNRVIGLGLSEPLTRQIIDSIKSFYEHHEKYLVHYSSPMKPEQADSLLKQNGFYISGSWERIVRDNKPLNDSKTIADTFKVRQVDASLKESWVKFLIDTYQFDFYEWPRAFALRNGWKHYIALRKNKIVACRSFFMTGKKTIFSGVDAPVPGVMTIDCAPDFAIWRRAIADGLKEGAILFVADIELPDKEKNKAAYEGFKQLGFDIPYTRYHYRLNK